MSFSLLLHSVILVAFVALGLIVFLTNPRRVTNQFFLLLTTIAGTWLGFLILAFSSHDLTTIEWAIRLASFFAIFIPCSFNTLRVSITQRRGGFRSVLGSVRAMNIIACLLAPLCLTRFFLESAIIPIDTGGIPEPVYGPVIIVYAVFQFISNLWVAVALVQNIRHTTAIQRVELQFVLLASGLSSFFAVLVTVIFPILFRNSQLVQFAPATVLLFGGCIAYGIATKRILDVANVLRLGIAYGLLAVYLLVLYSAVWYGIRMIGILFVVNTDWIAGFAGALLVVGSLAPAHGKLQAFANRLFVRSHTTDVAHTAQRASAILQSIGTLDALLKRFSSVVIDSVGARDVYILFEEKGRFRLAYPRSNCGEILPGGVMKVDSPTVRSLRQSQQPLIVDVMNRRQLSALLARAGEELSSMGVAAAVGFAPRAVSRA